MSETIGIRCGVCEASIGEIWSIWSGEGKQLIEQHLAASPECAEVTA